MSAADNALLAGRFIAVSGNIGAGKSTLVSRLAAATGSRGITESHEDNPFLLPFYDQPKRWAFHVQTGFLVLSAADYETVARHGGGAVLERTLEEHHRVFAAVLRDRGLLSAGEFALLDQLCAGAAVRVPATPHLLVHLTAPAAELDQRISARARDGESGVTLDYLDSLNQAYEEFVDAWAECPAVRIDTIAVDSRTDHGLATIIAECARALAGAPGSGTSGGSGG